MDRLCKIYIYFPSYILSYISSNKRIYRRNYKTITNAFFLISGYLFCQDIILFCKSIANILHKKKFIEFLGKNTIIISAVQNYVIGVIKILSFHFYSLNYFNEKYILN